MCILDCWPSSLEAYPPKTASPDLILLHSGFLPLLPAGAIMISGWPLLKSIHSFTQSPSYLLTTMHRHCVRCLVAMVNKTQCLFFLKKHMGYTIHERQLLFPVSVLSLLQVSSSFQTHNPPLSVWQLEAHFLVKHWEPWSVKNNTDINWALPETMNNRSVAQQALVWEEETKDPLDCGKGAFERKFCSLCLAIKKGEGPLSFGLRLFF